MLEKTVRKIMPCLDIKDGKVVKGVNFVNIKEMGHPLDLAKNYEVAGADELAFLDISKTEDGHSFYLDLIKEITQAIQIPLTVGGGIKTLEDIETLLSIGASKVSIASAAILSPDFIIQAVEKFGKGKIVLAFDVAEDPIDGKYYAYTHGGSKKSDFEVFDLIRKYDKVGVAAYLVTSIAFDGAKTGFDLAFFKEAEKMTSTPFIASGGAGKIEDFIQLFKETRVEYGLGASVFHQNIIDIKDLKDQLASEGIPIQR